MQDGFLLPYRALLDLDSDVDLEPFAVYVPDEHTPAFSYASEHVGHDAALSLLISLAKSVDGFRSLVPGSWAAVRSWLDARIGEVWEARGPCPGLGAALTAFGVSEGTLLAMAAQSVTGDNEDPWPLVDRWFRDPASRPASAPPISSVIAQTWAHISDERRALLTLLSRFDITGTQATWLYQETERSKAGITATDAEILANPFLVFEATRPTPAPVAVGTVDRGVFPDDRVRSAHPLPPPSAVDDPVDPRRVRAHVIDVLEEAAAMGDTLRSEDRVIQEIRDRPIDPPCPVSRDVMTVCDKALPPEVASARMAGGAAAYQLARMAAARATIAREVNRRRSGKPLAVEGDWRALVDAELGPMPHVDEEEELARNEKAAALEVLATSRIAVLVGAAGTGKTTLLRALCTLESVRAGGLLLLAPTGKARVRMQEAIGHETGATAQTLAQLLVHSDRYDPITGRYLRSDRARYKAARTVIVDESSMLTEDALDALLDGIAGVERLILVGDPRQLPPIGAGRPFVDIVEHLRREGNVGGYPKVGACFAELTVPRRQVTTGGKSDERADLLLAEWFAGGDPSPGADEVWDLLRRRQDLATVAVRRWTTPEELRDLLRTELAAHLDDMSSDDDAFGFQLSYGGKRVGNYVYFNRDAAAKVEAWQVLSPVRATGGGVTELNRMLQRTYREATLELARNGWGWNQKVPKPAGPQEVIYGDKVINIRNGSRKHYFPSNPDVLAYVANGEIGVVCGPFNPKGKKVPLGHLDVAFSTQPATAYKFWPNEMGGDDSAPVLELAYAITVHKAQGSEFGQTFVILPNPCRLLSRELLYTALTRQREHITLLYQGDLSDLRRYSSAALSETAARMTNLFEDPAPVEVDGRFLEGGLIHRARNGIAVRSKSEVIIADLLYSKGIDFEYERQFAGSDGTWRSPDFTIDDPATGTTILWEHLGMLERPSYRRKWSEKLEWYRRNGVELHEKGGGTAGILVTTQDGADGSISSASIEALVNDLLG